MILKLTQVPDSAENLSASQTLLVNLDQVSAIHANKIVRKVAIIGEENEIDGSVVTLNNGRAFPVKEKADDIYAKLPWPLTRTSLKQDDDQTPTSHA
jgi:hypothetical protein